MRFRQFFTLTAALVIAPFLYAQQLPETPPAPTAEDTAFNSIVQSARKAMQGSEKPSAEDLKTRREASLELVAKAKKFVKDYPASEKGDDAQSMWNLGLLEAAITGDSNSAAELKTRAADMVKDSKVPDMLKLHVFCLNQLAQWAIKDGRQSVDENSPEFRKAYMETFFAAANVLSNKDDIFKMLLLQAKSGRELSDEDKKAIAQRVIDNPNASTAIKAAAKQIVTGEAAYAVGKPLELSFTALDGTKINLADMKGKVVLIDFWATWCGPCVAEMPNVKSVYAKLHAQGFEIIGVSLDTSKDDLQKFIKKNSIPWAQYFDGKQWNNDISSRFGIDAIPAEWLIDKKGILRNTNARGDIEGAVSALLKEK